MDDLRAFFQERTPAMLETLTALITLESFTTHKPSVDRLVDDVAARLRALNPDALQRIPQASAGDCLLARFGDAHAGPPILLLLHLDTVWPIGTVAERPPHIAPDGRLYGPGSVDMKASVAMLLEVIAGLKAHGAFPDRPIWALFTTDEETGAAHSHTLIEETARQCGLVIVLEPGAPSGAIKAGRKGNALYRLLIDGRAAHAGNAPEEGVNAIIEFAQQAMAINTLNDWRNGTSVSVTMVTGGIADNVIPDRVIAAIDVRAFSTRTMEDIDAALQALFPHIPGAAVVAERQAYRPPMERNATAIAQLKAIGERHGMTVREETVGGGSDGNLTAALGIPTIDGLGPYGDGLHARHEHVVIGSLAERATLLAHLLREWRF
jgi:glutamate carboxypeptidase